MKRRALIALLLLVPMPTLAVLFGMVWFPGTSLGMSVFALSKALVCLLPLAWWILVERQRPSLSPARQGGLATGAATGMVFALLILGAYRLLGARYLDAAEIGRLARGIGLSSPARYIGGSIYWICVNSLLEEYCWRWFVVFQLERLMPSRWAIALSATGFTLHHIFAMRVYFPAPIVLLATAGIFVAGATWSWCYVRYRSIWPGYLSHAIADLAILGIGYTMIWL